MTFSIYHTVQINFQFSEQHIHYDAAFSISTITVNEVLQIKQCIFFPGEK